MPDDILINISAKADGITPATKALADLGEQDKKNQESMKKTTGIVNDANKSLDTLANNVKNASKASLGNISKQIQQLQVDANKSGNEFKVLAQAIDVGKQKLATLTAGTPEFKKLDDAIKAGEQILQGFTIETGKATGAQASFRSQIRESREEIARMLANGELTTAQLYDMAKGTGHLKDAMNDANKAISTLGSDTFVFDAMLQSVQSIGAGFQLATGAMALFGEKDEDLQEVLVRLNAIMAITQGLQQIQNALQKDSAQSLGVNILVQKLYATVVGQSTGAMAAFRIVLASITGVGAIAALVLIVSNWKAIRDAITGTTEAERLYAEARSQAIEDSAKELAGLAELQVALQDDNVSRAQKNELIQQAKKDYPEYIGQLSDEEFYTTAINKAIDKQRQLILARATARAFEKLIQDQIIKNQKLETEGISKLSAIWAFIKSGPVGVADAVVDQMQDGKKALDQLLDGYLKAVEEVNKLGGTLSSNEDKLSKKRTDNNKREIDQRRQFGQERADLEREIEAKELKELQEQGEKRREELRKQHEKELADNEKNLEKRIDQEKKAAKEIADAQADANKAKQNEYIKNQDLMVQASWNAAQATIQIVQAVLSSEINAYNAEANQRIKNLEKQRDQELKNKDLTENQKQRIQERYDKQIAHIKNEQAKKQREADIAQAIVSTGLAILNAAQTKPFIPLGLIAVAAATALGALQIATIARQPVPQFKGGTKNSPPGFKWVGEEGPELMHDGGGKAIITHGESKLLAGLLDKYGIGHSIPDGLFPDIAYPNPQVSKSAMARITQGSVPVQAGIDHEKMGKVMAKHLAREMKNNPHFELNIDKNGLNLYVHEGQSRIEFISNQYSSKQ